MENPNSYYERLIDQRRRLVVLFVLPEGLLCMNNFNKLKRVFPKLYISLKMTKLPSKILFALFCFEILGVVQFHLLSPSLRSDLIVCSVSYFITGQHENKRIWNFVRVYFSEEKSSKNSERNREDFYFDSRVIHTL